MIYYKKKLREEGNIEGAQLMNKVLDQDEAFNIQDRMNVPRNRKMTPGEALSISMEAGLSKHDDEVIRDIAINVVMIHTKVI